MEHNKRIRILWEKLPEGNARLLGVFGSEPVCLLPETVGNCPVTEIGDYCFAKSRKLPETYLETVLLQNGSGKEVSWETVGASAPPEHDLTLTELSGSYLEEITLPENLRKIGNMAFYNCVSLKNISMGKGMEEVGSDAFMNCRNLTRITLRCGVREKSGIRLVLSQMPSDLEVTFLGKEGVEAVVFYPEYYESYDEIAPAHLFGRNIEGEGFRARQCFKDGVPNLAQYDTIFPKASAEESGRTLRRLALTRLRYPIDMGGRALELYKAYVTDHRIEIAEELAGEKDLAYLQCLCEKQLLSADALEAAIGTAAVMGWAEGTAALLCMKRQYFRPSADRYQFDDF